MDILSAFGLSASAGLNAYIPLMVIALIAKFFPNLLNLAEPWDVMSSWWIIGLLIVLSVVEFFADKVPAVNHVNDIIQTVVRPVAGAIAFAASADVLTEVHPVLSLAAGLLIAGGVHVVKAAAVRPAITATTGGTGNVPVSILEDVISTVLSILAVVIPVLVAVLAIVLTSLFVYWLYRRAERRRERQQI